MERKLDLRPCFVWVGGDAFVQIVDVKLNGSTSDLSLNIQVLNKSGFDLSKADYEIYFYNSVDTKLQDEAYIVSGENLNIKTNDIGMGLNINISSSFQSARRAEVKILKADFANGKSLDLIYEDMEKFAISPIKDEDLSLLKTVAGDDAICMPAKLILNWRCVCGYFNTDESELCSNCMRDKSQIFADYGSIDKIKDIIERELLGDIQLEEDNLLEDFQIPVNEKDEQKSQEMAKEEVEIPKVQIDQEQEEDSQEKTEKNTILSEMKDFFANTSKLNIAMIFFAGVLVSASVFIFIFRIK